MSSETGRNSPLHVLYRDEGVELSIVKSFIYTKNIPKLTEVVCIILDRLSGDTSRGIYPCKSGTAGAELACIDFLGINYGRRSITDVYYAPLLAIDQECGDLVHFFSVLRSRTNWKTSSEFILALNTSEYSQYKEKYNYLWCHLTQSGQQQQLYSLSLQYAFTNTIYTYKLKQYISLSDNNIQLSYDYLYLWINPKKSYMTTLGFLLGKDPESYNIYINNIIEKITMISVSTGSYHLLETFFTPWQFGPLNIDAKTQYYDLYSGVWDYIKKREVLLLQSSTQKSKSTTVSPSSSYSTDKNIDDNNTEDNTVIIQQYIDKYILPDDILMYLRKSRPLHSYLWSHTFDDEISQLEATLQLKKNSRSSSVSGANKDIDIVEKRSIALLNKLCDDAGLETLSSSTSSSYNIDYNLVLQSIKYHKDVYTQFFHWIMSQRRFLISPDHVSSPTDTIDDTRPSLDYIIQLMDDPKSLLHFRRMWYPEDYILVYITSYHLKDIITLEYFHTIGVSNDNIFINNPTTGYDYYSINNVIMSSQKDDVISSLYKSQTMSLQSLDDNRENNNNKLNNNDNTLLFPDLQYFKAHIDILKPPSQNKILSSLYKLRKQQWILNYNINNIVYDNWIQYCIFKYILLRWIIIILVQNNLYHIITYILQYINDDNNKLLSNSNNTILIHDKDYIPHGYELYDVLSMSQEYNNNNNNPYTTHDNNNISLISTGITPYNSSKYVLSQVTITTLMKGLSAISSQYKTFSPSLQYNDNINIISLACSTPLVTINTLVYLIKHKCSIRTNSNTLSQYNEPIQHNILYSIIISPCTLYKYNKLIYIQQFIQRNHKLVPYLNIFHIMYALGDRYRNDFMISGHFSTIDVLFILDTILTPQYTHKTVSSSSSSKKPSPTDRPFSIPLLHSLQHDGKDCRDIISLFMDTMRIIPFNNDYNVNISDATIASRLQPISMHKPNNNGIQSNNNDDKYDNNTDDDDNNNNDNNNNDDNTVYKLVQRDDKRTLSHFWLSLTSKQQDIYRESCTSILSLLLTPMDKDGYQLQNSGDLYNYSHRLMKTHSITHIIEHIILTRNISALVMIIQLGYIISPIDIMYLCQSVYYTYDEYDYYDENLCILDQQWLKNKYNDIHSILKSKIIKDYKNKMGYDIDSITLNNIINNNNIKELSSPCTGYELLTQTTFLAAEKSIIARYKKYIFSSFSQFYNIPYGLYPHPLQYNNTNNNIDDILNDIILPHSIKHPINEYFNTIITYQASDKHYSSSNNIKYNENTSFSSILGSQSPTIPLIAKKRLDRALLSNTQYINNDNTQSHHNNDEYYWSRLIDLTLTGTTPTYSQPIMVLNKYKTAIFEQMCILQEFIDKIGPIKECFEEQDSVDNIDNYNVDEDEDYDDSINTNKHNNTNRSKSIKKSKIVVISDDAKINYNKIISMIQELEKVLISIEQVYRQIQTGYLTLLEDKFLSSDGYGGMPSLSTLVTKGSVDSTPELPPQRSSFLHIFFLLVGSTPTSFPTFFNDHYFLSFPYKYSNHILYTIYSSLQPYKQPNIEQLSLLVQYSSYTDHYLVRLSQKRLIHNVIQRIIQKPDYSFIIKELPNLVPYESIVPQLTTVTTKKPSFMQKTPERGQSRNDEDNNNNNDDDDDDEYVSMDNYTIVTSITLNQSEKSKSNSVMKSDQDLDQDENQRDGTTLTDNQFNTTSTTTTVSTTSSSTKPTTLIQQQPASSLVVSSPSISQMEYLERQNKRILSSLLLMMVDVVIDTQYTVSTKIAEMDAMAKWSQLRYSQDSSHNNIKKHTRTDNSLDSTSLYGSTLYSLFPYNVNTSMTTDSYRLYYYIIQYLGYIPHYFIVLYLKYLRFSHAAPIVDIIHHFISLGGYTQTINTITAMSMNNKIYNPYLWYKFISPHPITMISSPLLSSIYIYINQLVSYKSSNTLLSSITCTIDQNNSIEYSALHHTDIYYNIPSSIQLYTQYILSQDIKYHTNIFKHNIIHLLSSIGQYRRVCGIIILLTLHSLNQLSSSSSSSSVLTQALKHEENEFTTTSTNDDDDNNNNKQSLNLSIPSLTPLSASIFQCDIWNNTFLHHISSSQLLYYKQKFIIPYHCDIHHVLSTQLYNINTINNNNASIGTTTNDNNAMIPASSPTNSTSSLSGHNIPLESYDTSSSLLHPSYTPSLYPSPHLKTCEMMGSHPYNDHQAQPSFSSKPISSTLSSSLSSSSSLHQSKQYTTSDHILYSIENDEILYIDDIEKHNRYLIENSIPYYIDDMEEYINMNTNDNNSNCNNDKNNNNTTDSNKSGDNNNNTTNNKDVVINKDNNKSLFRLYQLFDNSLSLSTQSPHVSDLHHSNDDDNDNNTTNNNINNNNIITSSRSLHFQYLLDSTLSVLDLCDQYNHNDDNNNNNNISSLSLFSPLSTDLGLILATIKYAMIHSPQLCQIYTESRQKRSNMLPSSDNHNNENAASSSEPHNQQKYQHTLYTTSINDLIPYNHHNINIDEYNQYNERQARILTNPSLYPNDDDIDIYMNSTYDLLYDAINSSALSSTVGIPDQNVQQGQALEHITSSLSDNSSSVTPELIESREYLPSSSDSSNQNSSDSSNQNDSTPSHVPQSTNATRYAC